MIKREKQNRKQNGYWQALERFSGTLVERFSGTSVLRGHYETPLKNFRIYLSARASNVTRPEQRENELLAKEVSSALDLSRR